MRLKNKKTGEIVDLVEGYIKDSYYGQKIEIKPLAISNKEGYMYDSLAELCEEWEDVPEPEGWWFIDRCYEAHATNSTLRNVVADKEIGNYFGTKEEAEKAVLKLKAWKRLKDKGFRFIEWEEGTKDYKVMITGILPKGLLDDEQDIEDLDLLFDGGEE